MAVDVEEFFNRVHNTNDGRFGTSGTGGGHYAGRAKGAKRPSLKSGATPKAGKPLASRPNKVSPEGKARAAETAKKANAPKRDIDAEAKAHVAGLVNKFSAERAARKLANKGKPAEAPRKEGGDTAKLNEIQKLRQQINKNSAPAPARKAAAAAPKRDINAEAKAHVAGLMAKHSADRAARKEANKGKPAAAPKKEEGGDTAKLNDIAKLKAQLKANPAPANKPAAAGPKPAQAKQDAGQKAPASKKVKVPLSERLKKAAAFAKKLGEGVVKDNLTTSQYNSWKKSHDPSFKGEKLTVRNTFLTGRQQR